MKLENKKLLKDVLSCIEQINSYLSDIKGFQNYDNNPLVQDAVERNLITIGEAINALLKIDSKIPISNSRRIVDARNKLTHGYDEIENLMIWSILQIHLPVLKAEVEKLLYEE